MHTPPRMFLRGLSYALAGIIFGLIEHVCPLEQLLPWAGLLTPFAAWGMPALAVGCYESRQRLRWWGIALAIMVFWFFALVAYYGYDLAWYQIVQPTWLNVSWPDYLAQYLRELQEWTLIGAAADMVLSTAIFFVARFAGRRQLRWRMPWPHR